MGTMQILDESVWVQELLAVLSAEAQPEQVILALCRLVHSKDPAILTHGQRTSRYAVALGKAVGLTGGDLVDLRYAGLFHDIGTLTLPPSVLYKVGPLTADEYALVQSHPRAGAELLAALPLLRVPAIWIAHHHERWDGTGYPYGIRDVFIPLGARILAVADTFDAITSPAAALGRQALDGASACRLLGLLAGSQLDPELVEAFRHLLSVGLSHEQDTNAHG